MGYIQTPSRPLCSASEPNADLTERTQGFLELLWCSVLGAVLSTRLWFVGACGCVGKYALRSW